MLQSLPEAAKRLGYEEIKPDQRAFSNLQICLRKGLTCIYQLGRVSHCAMFYTVQPIYYMHGLGLPDG